jgi:hypothetical protein
MFGNFHQRTGCAVKASCTLYTPDLLSTSPATARVTHSASQQSQISRDTKGANFFVTLCLGCLRQIRPHADSSQSSFIVSVLRSSLAPSPPDGLEDRWVGTRPVRAGRGPQRRIGRRLAERPARFLAGAPLVPRCAGLPDKRPRQGSGNGWELPTAAPWSSPHTTGRP